MKLLPEASVLVEQMGYVLGEVVGFDNHLNLTLNFRIEGFNCVVFVTSDMPKCFKCGAEGHLIKTCPKARKVPGLQA